MFSSIFKNVLSVSSLVPDFAAAYFKNASEMLMSPQNLECQITYYLTELKLEEFSVVFSPPSLWQLAYAQKCRCALIKKHCIENIVEAVIHGK